MRNGSAPVSTPIYNRLRAAILAGQVKPGDRLPASRVMAREAGVSRNSVLAAWDRLMTEGYLEARPGSATRVRRDLPHEPAAARPAGAPLSLSAWARGLDHVPDEYPPSPLPWDFRSTQPAVDELPLALWRRTSGQVWRSLTARDLDYQEPAGRRELRVALARQLGLQRGVKAEPDHIVIVHGAQQALDLLARLLIQSGDRVLMEQPGYAGARLAFTAEGASVIPIPVDREGLRTGDLPRNAKLLYTTPSHQYPTGAVLPLERRLALLAWAAEANALIVEDDYNAEFRYEGRPVQALQGLDAGGRVAYVGTFSKTLFPALRIGYVVAPPVLVDPLMRAKWLTDQHVATEPQLLLARLIDDGHLDRYVRRMTKIYAAKARLLQTALRPAADALAVPSPVQGLHLYCPLTAGIDPVQLVQKAAAEGVGLRWTPGPGGPGLIMGFARLSEAQIMEGGRRLATVLQREASIQRRGPR